MSYVIGVDGGNTKTVAIAADLNGQVVGAGKTGSSNWEIQGESTAASSIAAAIRAALGDKIPLSQVKRIHLGLAGMDWPDDEPKLRNALAPHLGGVPMTFENDAYLAVRACTPDGVGITVSSGSGVCASFVDANDEKFFYGYFAEMGGGIDIDERTLQAMVRADDGRGPATMLTAGVLNATGHKTVEDLLYAITRKAYVIPHSVTRRVLFGAARECDEAAVAIVTGFARELALLATNLIRKRKLADESVCVVASGSLFTQTGPLMFSVFQEDVRRVAPAARIILCRTPPAAGAVRVALEACGVDTKPLWEKMSVQFEKVAASHD